MVNLGAGFGPPSPNRRGYHLGIISIDFETRSTVELRATGVYPYSQHPETDFWCLAWAIDEMDPLIWTPEDGPLPEELVAAILCGFEMRAWNAQFERVMWQNIGVPRYGFPEIPLEYWRDTAAEAAMMALPRNLDQCGRVLKVSEQKDNEGHRLMLRMARPRSTKGGKIVWWDVPERRRKLEEYCKQDVRTERAIYHKTLRLPERELAIYQLDQRINDRGLLLDVKLAKAAKKIVKQGLRQANEDIYLATDGAVGRITQVADLKDWLRTDHGIETDSLAKNAVREMLEGELPSPARRALEIRAEAGRSSIAKIDSMLAARCRDDRLRGLLLYHGANTGRWAGKLVQPHNFPRGDVKDVEEYIDLVLRNDYLGLDAMYPPMAIVSSMLRSMLRAAPGHRLDAADFSQIEARVTAWLAGEQWLLDAFRTKRKVYEIMAADIYGISPDDVLKGSDERQLGKATILGAGFGMGWEKFIRAAKTMYGLDIDEEMAKRVIATYREKNSRIVELWSRLETAAFNAVQHPGRRFTVGHVGIFVHRPYLVIALPAQRALFYADPKIMPWETPWGEMRDSVVAWSVNSQTKKWEPRSLYGGLLTENIVQAVARDIMADAMDRVENAGWPVVLTVHDEVVTEPTDNHSDLELFLHLMCQVPSWATGCPVEVEGWSGQRYRKD